MDNNEKEKDRGFSQGIILIIIGVIFTLITVFDFEINWHVMSKLWPLLLIIIGVCIMPINKWIRTAIALVLLVFGAMAYHEKADGNTDNSSKIRNRVEYKMKSHSSMDFDDDDDF